MKYGKIIRTLKIFEKFKEDLARDRLSQAYLFVCEDRLTAGSLILELGGLMVCQNQNLCGLCSDCAKANAGSHPDILVYPKGKSFAVLDAGEIYDNVQVKPMLAGKKIFIINDMDLATEQAQNKMLKIIEEPPKNVYFLISAKNENKVLKTILSRVQKNYVDKIDVSLLKNIINAEENIKQIALYQGDGYLGKTLEICENSEYLKNYENCKKIIKNLKISSQIPNFSGFLCQSKNTFENSLYILNDFFRDLLMLKLNKKQAIKNANLIAEFEDVENEYSVMALVEILKRLTMAKRKLESNVSLVSLADMLLLEILEVKFLCK